MDVTPYREILARMRSGDTDRRIARTGLMERHRIVALRRLAEHAGWLDPRSPLPDDGVVLAQLQPSVRRPSPAPGAQAVAPIAPHGTTAQGAQPWYVAEGQHGEHLLAEGHADEAAQVFAGLLGRVGVEASYARAVLLGRLARCFYMSGRAKQAVARIQEALSVIEELAPSEGLRALQGSLQSELGEVLRSMGQLDRAKQAFRTALTIAEELRDPRARGVELSRLGALALAEGNKDEALERCRAALGLLRQIQEPLAEAAAWQQLGAVFHERQQWDEAERHYREAARIREQHGHLSSAQQSWDQLAVLNRQAGRFEAAECWCRRSIEADHQSGNRIRLGSHLTALADLLRSRPERLEEAFEVAQAALRIDTACDPASTPQLWQIYGVLADIVAAQAAAAGDDRRSAQLQAQARNYRQLHQYAPRFLAALARVGAEASYARAVLLGRLARCFTMSGHTEQAVARLQEALGVIEELVPGEGLGALQRALQSELEEVLRSTGQHDRQNQALSTETTMASAQHPVGPTPGCQSEQGGCLAFRVTVDQERITDYGLEEDLLVDGPRERSTISWAGEPASVDEDVRPMLAPCVRVRLDDEGAIRFCLPLGEPVFERHRGCMVIRRIRGEIAVAGISSILWRLIGAMDGSRCAGALVSEFPPSERETVVRALGVLAATGAVDVSGRPIGRFVHKATKKGFMPAGGLEGDDVLRWVMDGDAAGNPEMPRIALSQDIPERLHPFHALTRSRRSRRDFNGLPLSRGDFDALLHTACGVTGAMRWNEREIKLRAYPASGGLYAVQIYPVALRVEGLEPGVYRYRSADNALDTVRKDVDPALFIDTMLPAEREMVSGAAAMFCLTGRFARHEKKYGEGGYRMLVAEAGHISQNLILTAVALDLSARPFGGVFDDLLNHELGLDGEEEQFLLSVLVGHAGGTPAQRHERGT
jgi:SagB-type dehydrogenase family enzyme